MFGSGIGDTVITLQASLVRWSWEEDFGGCCEHSIARLQEAEKLSEFWNAKRQNAKTWVGECCWILYTTGYLELQGIIIWPVNSANASDPIHPLVNVITLKAAIRCFCSFEPCQTSLFTFKKEITKGWSQLSFNISSPGLMARRRRMLWRSLCRPFLGAWAAFGENFWWLGSYREVERRNDQTIWLSWRKDVLNPKSLWLFLSWFDDVFMKCLSWFYDLTRWRKNLTFQDFQRMCSSVLYLPGVFSLEAPWNYRVNGVNVTIRVETVDKSVKVKHVHLMAERLFVGWRLSWIAHLQMATTNLLGSLAHFGHKLPQHLSTCQPSFRMHWSVQEVPGVYCSIAYIVHENLKCIEKILSIWRGHFGTLAGIATVFWMDSKRSSIRSWTRSSSSQAILATGADCGSRYT